MILTVEEKRLFSLYRSESASETASVVREALSEISEPELCAAKGLLKKLESMNEVMFRIIVSELEDTYAG